MRSHVHSENREAETALKAARTIFDQANHWERFPNANESFANKNCVARQAHIICDAMTTCPAETYENVFFGRFSMNVKDEDENKTINCDLICCNANSNWLVYWTDNFYVLLLLWLCFFSRFSFAQTIVIKKTTIETTCHKTKMLEKSFSTELKTINRPINIRTW